MTRNSPPEISTRIAPFLQPESTVLGAGAASAASGTPPLRFGRRRCVSPHSVQGLRMKAAMSAVENEEEIMRVWTLIELFRLTRAELFALHRDIAHDLAAMPPGDPERPIALTNLRNISTALARPRPVPQRVGGGIGTIAALFAARACQRDRCGQARRAPGVFADVSCLKLLSLKVRKKAPACAGAGWLSGTRRGRSCRRSRSGGRRSAPRSWDRRA